ncbi:amine oxidase [Gordonia spumicola]|uniref:Amine oxidase n=1 Tax=Gordonia spumicola TaxID=589161 RepID=A0A7I9V6D1_9ACTN|nr:NAD(P)/FAD-dependent oxidoreductase [Gordonia spumicola]GEE00945.1 amine oxidase [Gordonia spumicola]
MTRTEADVVVIGGGMAGLVAATTLAAQGKDIVVLEAAERIGGRVESVRKGDYWLNVGTQFTEGTGTLIDKLDEHGIVRGTLAGKKIGLDLGDGEVLDTGNPVSLMLNAAMTMSDRIGLAKVGARIINGAVWLDPRFENTALGRRYRAFLDKKTGDYLLGGVRSDVARAMVQAWSGQWMGCDPEETAAGQFVFSVGMAIADPAKVPNFSLPEGGNQTLTDVLASDLGDRVRLGSTVRAVHWADDSVTVHYADADGVHELHAQRAVIAVPADIAAALLPELPPSYRTALDQISYGRYVIVGYFTEENGPARWDDFYGVSTPTRAFQAMFNHAAALRTGERRPGGALACFAGGSKADALMDLSDDEIVDRFNRDLLEVYPELEGKLGTPIVRKHHRVVPYWGPGGRATLPTLREPLGPIHFAGDYLLDVPSLADAAESGERAAQAIAAGLRP